MILKPWHKLDKYAIPIQTVRVAPRRGYCGGSDIVMQHVFCEYLLHKYTGPRGILIADLELIVFNRKATPLRNCQKRLISDAVLKPKLTETC